METNISTHSSLFGVFALSARERVICSDFCGSRVINKCRRTKTMLLCLLLAVGVASAVGNDAPPTPMAVSSNGALAKYVRAFSRPGAFKELRSVFGEETADATAPPCPAGDDGLQCRQREARRVLDDCPGGDCEACIGCNRSNLWPRCCQQNAMCCSNLAQACQRCEPLELKSFCAKNFKRCF